MNGKHASKLAHIAHMIVSVGIFIRQTMVVSFCTLACQSMRALESIVRKIPQYAQQHDNVMTCVHFFTIEFSIQGKQTIQKCCRGV